MDATYFLDLLSAVPSGDWITGILPRGAHRGYLSLLELESGEY